MNTFYIARHGETENNRAGKLSGWLDSPLTTDGLEATKRASAKLSSVRIDEIYSSDLGRASTTAFAIAWNIGYHKPVVQLEGLREVNYGDAGGMLRKNAYAMYPRLDRDTEYAPPNGQSLAEMQKTVFETLETLNKKHTDSNILLVCHSGVMAALKASHIGQDFAEHNISEAYPHDYVGVFTFEDGKVTSFKELAGEPVNSHSS